MVRNDEIIAQHCMDNRLPSKCAYEVQQTTVLLPESTMLSNSISQYSHCTSALSFIGEENVCILVKGNSASVLTCESNCN